jgi:hypothetical protein
MAGSGNPILDQFDRDGIVTPGLARAVALFREKNLAQLAPGEAPTQPRGLVALPGEQPRAPMPFGGPQESPAPGLVSSLNGQPAPASPGLVPMGSTPAPTSPGLVRLPGSPAPAPSVQAAPDSPGLVRLPGQTTPLNTPLQRDQGEVTRLTAPPRPSNDPLAHTHADTGRSGIEQIHNTWGRNALRVLDAIGSGFAPRLTSFIPGTQLHHEGLVNIARHNVNQDEATANEEAKRGEIPGQEALREAQTKEANANAEAKLHPNPKQEGAGKTLETDQGIMQWNPETQRYDIPVGHAPGKESSNIHVLPNGKVIAVHGDPKTGKSSAEVVYEGEAGTTPKVVSLEVGGKPHQVLIDEKSGKTLKDLGETGEKPPTVNVNAGNNERDREAARFAKSHEKAVSDATAQLEKIAEARSMINGSAEAQALGIPKVLTALVSGQGTGVRITQPELSAIAKARGIKGDVEGFINSVSGKGKLTAEQKTQLTQILDDVKTRISQKQAIHNAALDNINGAGSREDIVRFDKEARQNISDFESGKGGAANVSTQAEFDALPRGMVYMEGGKKYRKP